MPKATGGTAPTFASRSWRGLVILCLYGYQGLVAGVALTAVPNWQAALGASAAAIGAYVALVGLPWTIQPLWGPVVDRFGGSRMGRRRPWVLAGMAGALASLALLPWAADGDTGSLPRLGLVFLAHGAFASLLDTAADGMIIDRVPAGRLGQATALTRVGFASGTAAGAALFSWLIPAWGLPAAALLLLLLGGAAACAPLAVRETAEDDLLPLRRRPRPEAGAEGAGVSLGRLLRDLAVALRRRDALALLVLCIAGEFVVSAFGVRLAVEMVQVGGWDPAALSRLQGALALAAGTVGALAVGWWSDRAGPARALLALLALCTAAHLGAGLLLLLPGAASLSGPAAACALALSGTAPALFFVALAPAVMLSSRGAAAATRFALFMAALNLGGVAGAAASGPIGSLLAPSQTALAAALVFAACAAAATRPRLLFPPSDGGVRTGARPAHR